MDGLSYRILLMTSLEQTKNIAIYVFNSLSSQNSPCLGLGSTLSKEESMEMKLIILSGLFT